ncbi:hypothetical protein MNB_SUP05-SYMBIONT-4-390 [hydrothermal vent metagenome]|uniref:Uncharacterized protein n=1 Tax=hydrothermal vent metagenome TaxID=652676 RepID=A0A1W1E002_9ZZZZ
MNNHQKSIFYPSRGHYKEAPTWQFFKPCLSPARVRLKKITKLAKTKFC